MFGTVNISLLLSFLIPLLSCGYRLRQNSGLYGYEDPYSLSNALGATEVQRRQLADLPAQFRDDAYYPRSVGLSSSYMNLYDKPNDEYIGDSYPYGYYDLIKNMNTPQKRTAYHPHRVVPSVDEIRKLFSNARAPVKRVPSDERGKESVDPEASDKRSVKDDLAEMVAEKEELTDKLRQMIDAAEKLSSDKSGDVNVVTKTESVNTVNGPVEIKEKEISESIPLKDSSGGLTEKVVEVFEKEMKSENKEGGNKDHEESGSTDTNSDNSIDESNTGIDMPDSKTPELEQLINEYLSHSNTKSKRASRSDMQTIGSLLSQIADLKAQLNSLQIEKTLEDKENDYLANALKYATLDQLVGGEEFMTKEYDDIVKATQTEELLQLLLQKAEEAEDEENKEHGDGVNEGVLEKRTGADNEGWYDTPITEKVVGGAELHSLEEKRAPVRSEMGSEFPIAIPYPDDSEETDDNPVNELTSEDSVLDDIDDTQDLADQEAEKNELLGEILSGLSPEQLRQLIEAYGDKEERDQDPGFCPAVMELSTNCDFTEEEGILIDDEARDLCNRHEMCYKCGPSIGLTQERCDQGYRNTVIENCDGDIRCLRSAILFLELMHQYHSYSLYESPMCQQPCVERFIYEGD